MTRIIEKLSSTNRILKFVNSFVKWFSVLYYKSILWIAYIIIINVLVFYEIDIINGFLLLFVLIILTIHAFIMQNSNSLEVYTKLCYSWFFFLFCVAFVTLARYAYQFLR